MFLGKDEELFKKALDTPKLTALLFQSLITHLFTQLEVLACKYEVGTQIFFTNHRIVCQFFRCSLEKNTAIEQQVCTIGQAQSFQCVVVGNQNTDILVL